MARRTSSGTEVLLGLLTISPMSGYDLGQLIQNSIRHFWNESYGQIYPNLRQLAAGGFITGKTEKQKRKPDRQVYSITKKGRERLAHWLQLAPQPEVPRNELLLKIFFGAQASPSTIKAYVEHMLESERAVLQGFSHIEREIAANPQYPDMPYWQIVLRYGQIELEAHLRWVEETLATLHKLEKDQLRPTTPIPAPKKDKRHAVK
jgi:PadR family transcriptional regulator, regulatory protein AphA